MKSIPTSINFPCVMLEKANTIGKHITEDNLMQKFALIRNENELKAMAIVFKHPVICHYYSVVNKAIEYDNILNSYQHEIPSNKRNI